MLNNYSILCHLESENLKRNCKYLEEYSKKYKLLYLPEEDVILIENKKISIIGSKKYNIFKNRRYEYRNSINLENDIING